MVVLEKLLELSDTDLPAATSLFHAQLKNLKRDHLSDFDTLTVLNAFSKLKCIDSQFLSLINTKLENKEYTKVNTITNILYTLAKIKFQPSLKALESV